jgi:hypothetical protein
MRDDLERTARFTESSFYRTISPRKFSTTLNGQYDSSLSSGPAEPYAVTRISRYIYHKSAFSVSQHKPKPSAFLPPPDLKMSSVFVDGLAEHAIWDIGDVLGQLRTRPESVVARADFDASILPGEKLTIEFDAEPHPRHINICGWPPQKDAQKSIALSLSEKSHLRLR